MIDLHIHSTASDGSFTPQQIIDLARQRGVRAISITDHDTLDGVKELVQLPLGDGPEWLTGVEISCDPPRPFKSFGSIHLLGYGFSIYDPQLNQLLEAAKKARQNRNPKIIEKLNTLGLDITLDQVRDRFGAVQTGRPHIAELLKEMGFVNSFDEAFDKYLAKEKPAYVEKFKVSCEQAVKTILNAGGIPVLAHPGLLDTENENDLEDFIDILISYGLKGLEIYYTDHDDPITRQLHDLAVRKELLITGGSDFHGTFNQGVELGLGTGNLDISYDLFKSLKTSIDREKENHHPLNLLESHIGYGFKNRELLVNALCHRSYINENQDRCVEDNERLEFLGDAVLGLCIGHLLMQLSPTENEGSLSKARSTLVSEPALAKMARQIDLGRFVHLGKGEALSRGFDKNSILSDAFEALIAAVYLDGGFDTVFKMVERIFSQQLAGIFAADKTADYKSALQEYAQEKGSAPPMYEMLEETGPDHDKTFRVKMTIFDTDATGSGKTKKAAEQDAASRALKILKR